MRYRSTSCRSESASFLGMVGGSRNGRAVKLALLVGLVLLTLYFLVSWKREAQTLTSNLALAEKEYEVVIKRYNRLEKELKGDHLQRPWMPQWKWPLVADSGATPATTCSYGHYPLVQCAAGPLRLDPLHTAGCLLPPPTNVLVTIPPKVDITLCFHVPLS